MARKTSTKPKTATKTAARPVAAKTTEAAAQKAKDGPSPSQLIDAKIRALGDWRGEALARVRTVIAAACPGVVETWKWGGVPVWEREGVICTGETYKTTVKLTFAKGASLADPARLFNSSLDGNVRRAIDIREGDRIDEKALATLIQAAAALNDSKKAAGRPKPSPKKPRSA